jgi:hypothetical protein
MPQVALCCFFLFIALLSNLHSKLSHWSPTPIRLPVMLSPFFSLPYRRLWERIQKRESFLTTSHVHRQSLVASIKKKKNIYEHCSLPAIEATLQSQE